MFGRCGRRCDDGVGLVGGRASLVQWVGVLGGVCGGWWGGVWWVVGVVVWQGHKVVLHSSVPESTFPTGPSVAAKWPL